MVVPLDIAVAAQQDLEEIVAVSVQAKQADRLHGFILPPTPKSAELEIQWTRLTLSNNLEDPHARVVKATLKGTDNVVGVSVLYANVSGKVNLEEPSSESDITAVDNGLLREYWNAILKMEKQSLEGKPHYTWLFPHILPQYQHQGVEEAIIRWAFPHFNLEKETIWSHTDKPGEVELFQRLGWSKVNSAVLSLRREQYHEGKDSSVELVGLSREPGQLAD